jgi:hypothetical protein
MLTEVQSSAHVAGAGLTGLVRAEPNAPKLAALAAALGLAAV